jgi:hypothetical protein
VHFGAQRATRDVDVLVLRGDLGGLRQAVRAIASQHEQHFLQEQGWEIE